MSRGYDTYDEMIAAESNGWIVVTIISDGKRTWPWTVGPFKTKREASNARARARTLFKKEKRTDYSDVAELTASFFVRPIWKDTR